MIRNMSKYEQALLFAKLSKIAYMKPTKAKIESKKLGFYFAEFYNADGAQAYRFQSANDTVIACRGTEPTELNDLKADLNAWPVKSESKSRVHAGFKSEADDLWPLLESKLRVGAVKNRDLWFTGHSLGAGMTTIMASRCFNAAHLSDPMAIFTFGSPRVGLKGYTKNLQTPHMRWVNNNDIVCRVPLAIMGYKHHGTECYFDAEGVERKSNLLFKLKEFLDGIWTSGAADPLTDHSIDGYISNIEANLKNNL